ncbi:MAG TPA: 23S rRNA (adenine(2030)-N(6))-methyltransferase RlmJ [Rhizomicrobium sp.]|nr:23S rRNA (adenine(2030)-N(6))-methyltransferase RlmJ [Rhizomicrobium sp.]
MNYRHAYHAGNFADVLKHTALVAVLLHLRKKDAPFAVFDSHAGRGLYDLGGAEAGKTGEAQDGIARLDAAPTDQPVLGTYLEIVRSFGRDHYPGSPLIAARLLRPQDRLIAIEKHPEESRALTAALQPWRKAQSILGDGYARLPALLPPPERRGVVLIDAPFEAPNEFEQIAGAFTKAWRRFATGTYLIWFPIKTRNDAEALGGELRAAGATKLLRLELSVGARVEGRLSETGLLIVNPPYGFAAAMRQTLHTVSPLIGHNAPAKARIDWLAGGE